MSRSEQTIFEVFIVTCMLGFIFPGFGKFVGAGCFILVIVWASCAITYKMNQEIFDKLEKDGFIGKLIPDLKGFMCGQDSIKDLVKVWILILFIGILQYFPTAYIFITSAAGGGSQ